MFSISLMTDPMSQHRSARLREYLGTLARPDDEEAQRRTFMQRTGYTKGRVSQLLSEGFGERSAQTIAAKLRLRDARWFDRPLGTPVNAPPAKLNVSSGQIDRPNGPAPEPVTNVTLLPEPFDHDRFASLPEEQRRDIAKVAALMVDAFSRYNTPPDKRGRPWGTGSRRVESEELQPKRRRPPKAGTG